MSFNPDAIARLSPAARVEVQDFYARKFLAEREVTELDRRAPKRRTEIEPPDTAELARYQMTASRPAWPRVWFRNDSSRPTSFPHRWPAPVSTARRRPHGSKRLVIEWPRPRLLGCRGGTRLMPYPESFIGPMRQELTRLGVQELKTAAQVDDVFVRRRAP